MRPADHAFLTAPTVPHKALVRMRLAGAGDVYVPVRNPLMTPDPAVGHRRASRSGPTGPDGDSTRSAVRSGWRPRWPRRAPVRLRLRPGGAARPGGRAVRAALPAGAHAALRGQGQRPPRRRCARSPARCDGFEVASGGELAAGPHRPGRRRGHRIVFAGPAKTDAELAAARRGRRRRSTWRARMELRRLAVAAEAAGAGPRWRCGSTGPAPALPGQHRMTGAPTPFGIDEARAGRGGRAGRRSCRRCA